MTAAFKAAGTEAHASSGNITVTLPGGASAPAANDMGYLWAITGSNPTLSAVGWSVEHSYQVDVNAEVYIFSRRMTGGDTNPTITGATQDIQANLILVSGGATSGSTISATSADQTNASSTTVTALGITPADNDALIIFFGAQYTTGASTSTFSAYSGANPAFTEAFDNNQQGSTINTSIFCAYGSQSGAPAATGNRTATATSSMVSSAFLLAIIPAGGATTTRGMPFGHRGTAFNGGRVFNGIIN